MPAKIVEIVTHATNMGQEVLNRFHFIDTDGVADPVILCADFKTHWLDVLKAGVSATLAWSDMTYQQIYPVMQLQHGYATGFPIHGTDGNVPEANTVAASVRWNLGDTINLDGSPVTKYIKRGGKRIGGMTRDTAGGDAMADVAVRGIIDSACNNLVAFPPDSWSFVVVHFPASPAPVPPALTSPRLPPTRYALVTGHVLKNVLGSQVSRKPGHGV